MPDHLLSNDAALQLAEKLDEMVNDSGKDCDGMTLHEISNAIKDVVAKNTSGVMIIVV